MDVRDLLVGASVLLIAVGAFRYGVPMMRRTQADKARKLNSMLEVPCILVLGQGGRVRFPTELRGVIVGVNDHMVEFVDTRDRVWTVHFDDVMAIKRRSGALVASWQRGLD